MIDVDGPVFVAGHRGMVGSAIVRRLRERGVADILTATREECDLTNSSRVQQFFGDHRISHVVMAAAKVGGIHANASYPASFIHENLAMACNVVQAAHHAGVQRLLFLGSSCIYPRMAAQPMREEALLTGPLEPTNEPYAIAKIAGIKLCEGFNRQYGRDYRCLMPTNLYGPGDNYHHEDSHVVPALLRRFHDAVETGRDEVIVWGSGEPRREFLHVDDLSDACLFVMGLGDDAWRSQTAPTRNFLNVGTGVDCSIRELTETLASITGFTGRLTWDTRRPDGAPRKLLDVSRLTQLGWHARIGLEDGLRQTYAHFLDASRAQRLRLG